MTQEEALKILKTGASVFLTGEAGSGKTFVLNRYAEYLREAGIDYALTASTGIAATHLHGMTIHSWSGVGVRQTLDEDDLKQIAENRAVARRVKKASVLVIDEISMLDGRVLSLVERICRKVRKTNLPFGGLQVILSGDFFQLPPVASSGETAQFSFESAAWEFLAPKICYLTEQHRQEDDAFLDLLAAIRRNRFGAAHLLRIRTRLVDTEALPDEDVTRLFSHNTDVDTINARELRRLPGKMRSFVMATRGPATLVDALVRNCLSPQRLDLKEGAAVMFTKNNPNEGFVNGTLGVVTGFEGDPLRPVVRTRAGDSVTVEPMEWLITDGETVLAKVVQLPLRLAWAMTIHKSQGVSLDAAVMDLSQTFEYGQGYVALSRVRRLSGVHLLGSNERAFQVHPLVLTVDGGFRTASEEATRWLAAQSAKQLKELQETFRIISGGKRKAGKKRTTMKTKAKQDDGAPTATAFDAIRERFPSAYRPWREEEEQRLKGLFQGGASVATLAKALGRKAGGIRSRLRKLGLLMDGKRG